MDGNKTHRAHQSCERPRFSLSSALLVAMVSAVLMVGCSTQTVDDTGATPDAGAETGTSDLSAFDQAAAAQVDQPPPAAAGADDFSAFNGAGDENAIEKELNNQPAQPAQGSPAADDFAAFDQKTEEKPLQQSPAIDPGTDPNAQQTQELPPPIEAPAPVVESQPPMMSDKPVTITSLKYKANDNGGTVIIEADGAMTFSVRNVSDKQQFVIDVPNSKL